MLSEAWLAVLSAMEFETSQARYEAALERSKEAHRRMIQSQRELRHEQASAAKQKEQERRRQMMAQIRAETDELVGKNVAKELEHVMPAPSHEMLSIAAQLAARLLRKDLGREDNSWYKVFKAVDTDKSGRIDFDEFRAMIRDHLRLSQTERSDYSLFSVRTLTTARTVHWRLRPTDFLCEPACSHVTNPLD